MRKPLHIFAALGFTSMVGQVLLMRELIVVFYGNELSLGIMLGCWLFWVGVGSLLAALIAPGIGPRRHLPVLAALHVLLGLVSVGSLLGVRALSFVLRRGSASEIVGYVPIVISSFLVLAPMCMLLGFLFAYFCHVWSTDEEAAVSIGSVYIFEALGAAIGGAAFVWVLVPMLDPCAIVCGILVLNLAASAAVLIVERPHRAGAIAVSVLAVAVAAGAFFGGADRLRDLSLRWLWQELAVTHSEDSIYGNIALVEKKEEAALYENGLLMFSYPDRFSAEEAVHFALLEHASPDRVLLIGGGVSGSLGEVLKHPVRHVDYVELDPRIIEVGREFFPPAIGMALDDPRVTVHTTDGRLFVKRTGGSYDVIIVDLPDPYTALINRFYTIEFYRECAARLARGGILSFRVSAAENYISAELQQFLGCLSRTLRSVFADVAAVPGESSIFLACNEPGVLTLASEELVRRIEERGIRDRLLFIREYYLPFRLSDERTERLASALKTADARVNTDLAPVCYYYHAILWSKQFEDVSGKILAALARVRPYWILLGITMVFVLALLRERFSRGSGGSKSILVAVGTTGFAEIIVEVVTLLGFQAVHGYVYHQVAVIVAAFMVGLAVGADVMRRIIERGGGGWRLLLLIQAVVCLYPMLLLGALVVFSRGGSMGEGATAIALQAQVAFSMLAFIAGAVGGLQFPLANALRLAEVPGAARAAGYTYAVDLLGSCLGALVATALLIPVFGIPFACLVASVLNVGSFLLLLLCSPSRAGRAATFAPPW